MFGLLLRSRIEAWFLETFGCFFLVPLHYSSSNCTVFVFWQSVGKIVVVPPVVPQIPPPAKKEAAVKPAAAMGRRLSRSSTFSCVDTKSQAAKVTYGKKLAKTVEDLPAPKETDSQTGNFTPAQSGKFHSSLYFWVLFLRSSVIFQVMPNGPNGV